MTPPLKLAAWREARGMTQLQLFEATGIRIATISRIENGRTLGVDFATLTKLAAALRLEPGQLFTLPPARRRR